MKQSRKLDMIIIQSKFNFNKGRGYVFRNGDEVIEADNGRLILANSGAYCDEDGNPTGGCIDDEEYVYITKLAVFIIRIEVAHL